ncbi:hypothetical protein B5X24_HaOG208382 [Helicoverpa armigera]|uniref:ZAD domain-containing protein n=1 Tax=Helicoverpa armigera TaxID=29058 RepID=A0A2W1BK34_HELAM|nr:hypothetical protein B5X24_HaOG208382 [Helicoverpa armigera]
MSSEISVVLDFNKICRACLLDTGPMKDLFAVCTPEIFKFCTSVEVDDGDNLPRQICQACLDLLNKSYYFKQAAVRSNLILKQQLLDEEQPVKLESLSNDHEILEINVAEIADDVLSQNIVSDNDLMPDRSMEPAEIISDKIMIAYFSGE